MNNSRDSSNDPTRKESKRFDKGQGFFLCFVGPAGAGKSSLVYSLISKYSDRVELSISATSRNPRQGEQDGKDYFFFSRAEFEKKISAGEFFEWEETHGNYYGTPNLWIEKVKEEGKIILLDVDVRGALTFSAAFAEFFQGVLVLPPSIDTLIERVQRRGSLQQDELLTRLKTATREYQDFLDAVENRVLDFFVLNDTLEIAKQEAEEILLGKVASMGTESRKELVETLKRQEQELLLQIQKEGDT